MSPKRSSSRCAAASRTWPSFYATGPRLVSGVLRGRVPIVGIVINVLNAAFIPELLGGIFEACERAGFSCMVYDSNAEPEREVDA